MLTLKLAGEEYYDEAKSEFVETPSVTLRLEHSLASLSAWESKWKKPFLTSDRKTSEEIISYIECMSLDPELPPGVLLRLDRDVVEAISAYLESSETATWFGDEQQTRQAKETITSEVIYYWLVALNIPFEVETWNLNRLFTLIRVSNAKNSKNANKPKVANQTQLEANRELNRQRREQLKTSG